MMNIDTIKLPDNLETVIGRKPFNKYVKCPICETQMGIESGDMQTDMSDPLVREFGHVSFIIRLQYACPKCFTKVEVNLKK